MPVNVRNEKAFKSPIMARSNAFGSILEEQDR